MGVWTLVPEELKRLKFMVITPLRDVSPGTNSTPFWPFNLFPFYSAIIFGRNVSSAIIGKHSTFSSWTKFLANASFPQNKHFGYDLEICIETIEGFCRGTIGWKKFDVLKTNICPRSEGSRANMLVLRTSNICFKNLKFPRGNYHPIGPRQKYSIV